MATARRRGHREGDLFLFADLLTQRHQSQYLVQCQVDWRHEEVLPDAVATSLLIEEERDVGALQQDQVAVDGSLGNAAGTGQSFGVPAILLLNQLDDLKDAMKTGVLSIERF